LNWGADLAVPGARVVFARSFAGRLALRQRKYVVHLHAEIHQHLTDGIFWFMLGVS
jgi:hypothetical protein